MSLSVIMPRNHLLHTETQGFIVTDECVVYVLLFITKLASMLGYQRTLKYKIEQSGRNISSYFTNRLLAMAGVDSE